MDESTARQTISRMMTAYWLSQAVYVAAKLRIADLLKDGPQTSDQLAEASGAHPAALHAAAPRLHQRIDRASPASRGPWAAALN